MLDNFDKLTPKLQKLFDFNAYELDWKHRPILEYGKYKVPCYHEGVTDDGTLSRRYLTEPIDCSLAWQVVNNKEKYKDKKIVDMGCGTGLPTIIMKDHGLNVIGIDHARLNVTGAIYTMMLNDIYYDLIFADEKIVDRLDYDVLFLNGIFRTWAFVDTMVPLMRREARKGKEVLFWTNKSHDKLLNYEKYMPKDRPDDGLPKVLFGN